MLHFESTLCPYCSEPIELAVDVSGGNQHYTEDCQVCCQPIRVRIHWPEGKVTPEVDINRENDD